MGIKVGVFGSGRRAIELLINNQSSEIEIVGVFDTNIVRANYFGQLTKCKVYSNYQDLLDHKELDAIFIMCTDDKHIFYIKKALKKNLIIYCEKPICTTLKDVDFIRNLQHEEKVKIKVLFNSRFMPINLAIKKVIEDYIGKIYTLNYSYFVDIKHGSEYFHRWHSEKNKSESLLTHKGSHHVDLINWWISDNIREKMIMSSHNFFKGVNNDCCRTCQLDCSYRYLNYDYLDQNLYFDGEYVDDYKRDKCVFSYKNDVPDCYATSLLYNKGALVNYSLNFLSTYHGFNLSIVGENGNLNANIIYDDKNENKIHLKLRNGEIMDIPIKKSSKKHFGADQNLINSLVENDEYLASVDEALDALLIKL